jgi:uncharacterized protein
MSGHVESVILKVAERCNINCSYCYMYNQEDSSFLHRPRFMSDAVFEATLQAMRRYCAKTSRLRMSIIFHGGEPTLIGKARFERLAERAATVLGSKLYGMSIQTNATLVDEEWVELFRRHQVHVGVSLDGPAWIHDTVRVDRQGRGTHARTVAGLARLQDGGLEPSVLCVIDPGRSGLEVYRYFRSLGISTLNFLLPDVSHDNKERFYGSRGPTPVADYLIPAFDAWYDEDNPNFKVRLFWGVIRMIMGGQGETDAFGNPLMGYVVVETDGAIEPLDALRVCDEGITRNTLNVQRHGFDELHLGQPLLHRVVHEGMPLSAPCRACHERTVCGGGYLPHRYARATGFDNPSVWCADILKLLTHIRSRIPRNAIVVGTKPGRSLL